MYTLVARFITKALVLLSQNPWYLLPPKTMTSLMDDPLVPDSSNSVAAVANPGKGEAVVTDDDKCRDVEEGKGADACDVIEGTACWSKNACDVVDVPENDNIRWINVTSFKPSWHILLSQGS